jgi:hypothetical protein
VRIARRGRGCSRGLIVLSEMRVEPIGELGYIFGESGPAMPCAFLDDEPVFDPRRVMSENRR